MPDFSYRGTHTSLGKHTLYENLVGLTSGRVAVDVETVSLDNRTPIGIGFATSYYDGYYFETGSPLLPRALQLLHNPDITKIFHNGHFDLKVIEDTWGIVVEPVVDTILAAQLLGHPLALGNLALQFINTVIPTIESLIGKGESAIGMDEVPLEKVAEKCCLDCQCSYVLWDIFKDTLPPAAFELDMRTMPVIMDLERRGMRIHVDRLNGHIKRIGDNVEYFRGIARGFGFNPGSSKQLAAILESRGWRVRYSRETGNPMLDKNIIEMYYREEPLAQLTVLYRGLRTLLTNTLQPILDKHLHSDGRIHPNIHQDVTGTGRFSQSKPNGQNITHDLRDIIIPTEGLTFESWDLSQIELRVIAYMSQDPAMLEVFDRPDGDIHSDTSMYIFGDALPHHRRIAKDINFAIVYGGDAYTLYNKSRVPIELGERYINLYFQKYAGVKRWIEQTRVEAHQNGYTSTLLGRRRSDPYIHEAEPWMYRKAERRLINHPIQGSAGEILKELMWRLMESGESQVNTIHDESLMEFELGHSPDYTIPVNLAPFNTPVTIKRGMDWKDMQEIATVG